MTYTVSITSQGQMSIPAPIRRQFNLDQIRKATVSVLKDAFVVSPIKSLLSLRGALHTNKKISQKVARAAFEDALAHGDV